VSTTIQEDLWNARSSWNYTAITDHEGTRLRVEIRRNAYDDQSHAICERWDGSTWQQVTSRPIEVMVSRIESYVTQTADIEKFRQDADDLRSRALAVIA